MNAPQSVRNLEVESYSNDLSNGKFEVSPEYCKMDGERNSLGEKNSSFIPRGSPRTILERPFLRVTARSSSSSYPRLRTLICSGASHQAGFGELVHQHLATIQSWRVTMAGETPFGLV